jgi:membrane protein required for colicin V production
VDAVAPIDVLVGVILGVAVLRGLFLGLVREAFSIAALGGACVAARLFHEPVGAWLEQTSDGRIGGLVAPWLAGALLAVGTIAVIVLAGRVLRRGVRWAGLGWADRAGGALLGAAEGALVAGILLVLAATLLGRGHPALQRAQSFATLERLEHLVQGGAVDVAAPPRRAADSGF